MNEKSRTTNSIRNSIIGAISQGCGIILNFVTRLFFVKYLNAEYLGVNGLFSNILTVLSLAELGVGTAIIYSLYKPVAEKEEKKIAALLNFYKTAYLIIGLFITVIGIALTPFLNLIIKDTPDIPELSVIYLLFLANTSCSYFFAYRRSIFSADQREYILSTYKLLFTILKAVGQCMVLILSKNFMLYLSIQIICTIAENLLVYYKSNKYYPFLKKYKKVKLSKKSITKIAIDIKSLMIYKIGSTALDGTDNIILSAFVGVVWVGKLSNYTLIVTSINMLATQVVSALTASIGNFIATEKKSRYEDLLFKVLFASFIIFGFSFVCLNCLLTPFVELVFGIQYCLGFAEVFVVSLNFYIFGMMNCVWTFRTTMGLFEHGKYRPIVSAIINIIVSIALAKEIGLLGVLVGTTITRVVTNVWFDPYVVYKYGIEEKPWKYYGKWMEYLSIALISIGLCEGIFRLIPSVSIYTFILRCIICVVVFGGLLIIITSRQEEFKYIKGVVLEKFTK